MPFFHLLHSLQNLPKRQHTHTHSPFTNAYTHSLRSTHTYSSEHTPENMWRSSFPLLKHGVTSSSAIFRSNPASFGSIGTGFVESTYQLCGYLFSSLSSSVRGGDHAEVMRLVDVEALKMKLGAGGNDVIQYSMFLQTCESMGLAKSAEEAKKLARVFDDSGVVFIFRDKVHLHPHKVMDMVRRAIPLALMPESDPRKEELKNLQAKQEEIDLLAHKQVNHILWAGLGLSLAQASFFFRLTFWEFSWDVMEPITFFTTSSGLILGYAYFLFTSKDPSYQDLMKRLFLSRRRKLMKKHNFDVERFMELKKKCISPIDCRGGV